jgi:hypothetical protein
MENAFNFRDQLASEYNIFYCSFATFRVFKNGKLREFGACRTQRLVLAEWYRLGVGVNESC